MPYTFRNHHSGFTLIEVILVLAILGILGFLIINASQASAQDAAPVGVGSSAEDLRTTVYVVPGPYNNVGIPGLSSGGTSIGIPLPPRGSDDGTVGHFMDWRRLRAERAARAAAAAVGSIAFGFDSDVLDADGKATVAEVALVLQANPEIILALEGHTDLVGGVEYNAGLSTRRAQSVRSEFANHGVDETRLTVVALGEGKPLRLITGKAPENRVVEVKAYLDFTR